MGDSYVFQLLVLFSWNISFGYLSIYNEPKVWWAKHISEYIYTAGRLSDREIKYAKESGFKSIISLFNYSIPGYRRNEYLPTTTETLTLTHDIVNINFAVIMDKPVTSWKNKETLHKVQNTLESMQAPILFYCETGFSSSFMGLLYNLNNSCHFTLEDFYNKASYLGYDYTSSNHLKNLVKQISREKTSFNGTLQSVNSHWYLYHHQKPLHFNWFIAGQIQKNHMENIIRSGIRTIINARLGVTIPFNHIPSQEEVTLLNIKDNVGTYIGDGRQSLSMLEINLLNSSRPASYISENSLFNFERNNPLQFGDEIGYNESLERIWIEQHGLKYIHIPLDSTNLYDIEVYKSNLHLLREAHKHGAVLVHCSTGLRSLILGLIGAGISYGKDRKWAIETVHQLGYKLNDGQYTKLLSILDDAKLNHKQEFLTENKCDIKHRVSSILFICILILTLST